MQPRSSSDGKSASSKAANKSAPSMTDKEHTEKKKLEKEIQQLRYIIEQDKWNIEVLRFKDVESTIESRDSKISHTSRIPNVEVQLRNDLYKFAGFRCVKSKRSEIVFNFVSTNEQQKDNTYCVQIFVGDGKGSLGKWVMPMSIDMKQILAKKPIENLKNVSAFLKLCKYNINCYTIRQQQFLLLKEHILQMKHCALHSNIGYTQFNLELYSVYDGKDDKFIDLIIYLLYHSEEARPYKVEVDTTAKHMLSDETKQRLKVHLKDFKKSDLRTAFDKVFMDKESELTWAQADDSPLEINDTSISDEEGFLEQIQSERKKSLRKAKRKRELRDKWNKRKRQKNMKIIASENDNNDDTHSEAEESYTENPHKTSINKKDTKKTASSLKQQKQTDENPSEATPMNKSKSKLKQTKLNFQSTPSSSNNVNKDSVLQSKPYTKLGSKNQKVAQLVSSTPMRPVAISTLEIDNITEIGSPPKKVADNLNDSKKNSRSRNKNSPKKRIQQLRKSPRSIKSLSSTHIKKYNKPRNKSNKK